MTEFEFNVETLCLCLSETELIKLAARKGPSGAWTDSFTAEEINASIDQYDLPKYKELRTILVEEAKIVDNI